MCSIVCRDPADSTSCVAAPEGPGNPLHSPQGGQGVGVPRAWCQCSTGKTAPAQDRQDDAWGLGASPEQEAAWGSFQEHAQTWAGGGGPKEGLVTEAEGTEGWGLEQRLS